MAQANVQLNVRRPADRVSVLDVQGTLTGPAEGALLAAYDAASPGADAIVLNLTGLASIDSAGAGLLMALAARARRQKQRLLAYGLCQECQRAFALTYLNEAVVRCADEADALARL